MTSLNISLPQALKEYLENQVRDGSYSTSSEYIRALLREDQKRRTQGKLEAALLEGHVLFIGGRDLMDKSL